MWRRHSEGFLVFGGILDKIGGCGGLYFYGSSSVLLRGPFEVLTFERVVATCLRNEERDERDEREYDRYVS